MVVSNLGPYFHMVEEQPISKHVTDGPGISHGLTPTVLPYAGCTFPTSLRKTLKGPRRFVEISRPSRSSGVGKGDGEVKKVDG